MMLWGGNSQSHTTRRTAVSFNRMVGRTGVHPGVKEIGDRYFCIAGEDRLYEDFEESKKVDDEVVDGEDSSLASGISSDDNQPRMMMEIERDPIKYYTPEEVRSQRHKLFYMLNH